MSRGSDDEDCFFVLYDTHPATEMEDRGRGRVFHSNEGLPPEIVEVIRRFDPSVWLDDTPHDDDPR